MSISELRTTLQHLQTILSASEVRARRLDELGQLIALLSRHEDLAVSEFCRRAETGLEASGDAGTSTAAGRPGPDLSRIEHHLGRLKDAASDESAFAAALAELKADRKVKQQELQAIANDLTGADIRYKSKRHAFDAISTWRNRKAGIERRLHQTSGIF